MVVTMTVRELFDFVTDVSINDSNIEAYLDEAMRITASRSPEDTDGQEKIDEEVGVTDIIKIESKSLNI